MPISSCIPFQTVELNCVSSVQHFSYEKLEWNPSRHLVQYAGIEHFLKAALEPGAQARLEAD
jgi:hypothetical protein